MKNTSIKLSLYLNYFVFAILLNSVGIVILKSQNVYGVGKVDASILEAFKDFPIAIVSFLVASFLPRIGYKKAMMIGLGIVTAACIAMYFGNSFWSAKMLFAAVGASFALIKVSVYASIGLVTNGEKEHNSLMSNIEGVFMFGIALAYFLFPAFHSESNPDAWLNVYWLLAGLSLAAMGILFFANFEEKEEVSGINLKEDFVAMFRLISRLLVIVFVVSAFLFVMIEQGIMTWLPTFNQEVLILPESIATMMASIFAISLGVGRILAGFITKKISWVWVLTACIIGAMTMFVFVLPKTVAAGAFTGNSLKDVTLIAYAFPLVGLFIAPIYPLLNSVVLSALPKKLHSPMAGLIIIFSALGGSLGSRLMAILFEEVGAGSAFYYVVIPLSLLLATLFVLRKMTNDAKKAAHV